jgi:transcriptional regulator with XRE-family HTH domain
MGNIDVGDVKTIFGRRLKQALIEKNVQQKTLAEELQISDKTMSSYVHGNANPTLLGLAKIAKYLNISADFLLGLSNELKPLENIDDPIGEDILMIRRSYTSMPEHQRKAVLRLVQSITDDKS